MIDSPYFYVTLSFFIFLIIGYKKIWPTLNTSIEEDINRLKIQFHDLNTTHYNLELALKNLKKSEVEHINLLKSIQDSGKEKVNIMINNHKKNYELLISNKQLQAKEILKRESKKHLKQTILELSKDFEDECRHFFSLSNSLDKSFSLLEQKDKI